MILSEEQPIFLQDLSLMMAKLGRYVPKYAKILVDGLKTLGEDGLRRFPEG